MKKILLATAVMLAGSFVSAQDADPTEFLYQAKGGESFIQGNLNYLSHTTEQKVGADNDFTDLDISASYEMGLSEMMSVYGSIGFGQGELDNGVNTTDFNGLNPINLGVKYRMQMGSGQLYVQGNLGLGVLAEADENRTDGSINLAARLGYIMTYETAMAGLVADLGVFSTDGSVKDGADFNKNSAFALSAFYEMKMSEMVVGYAATYSLDAGPAGVSNNSPFGGVFVQDDQGASILDLKVYTRIPMSEKLQLLGAINYGLILDQESDALDGGSNLGVNLGVRYFM